MRALLLLATAAYRAVADCSCGYVINSTHSDTYALFTEYLKTDFTLPNASLTWDSAPGSDWQAQAYNVSPSTARGPYGKSAELGNVVLNNQSLGLELWVRSQLIPNDAGQMMVPIAEIVPSRQDILYGSFRISMKTTAVNGTCGAFFFYHNDSQEIDMEILSKQQSQSQNQHILNLVLQSPASASAGYNAAGTPGFIPYNLPFDPTMEYHEYRFDWLPNRVDMFADGVWMHSFIEGVPGREGGMHVIHWSNGDGGWSGGPPGGDAVVMVGFVEAFFNSTMGPAGECSSGAAGGDVCEVGADGPVVQPTASPWSTASATATAAASSTASHSGVAGRIASHCWARISFAALAALLLPP